MNIRHLKIFQTVCEQGSITHAAQQLYMTQPAVSHVIRSLEETLGYPLFDRISRRLYLTPAGSLFLEKTRQVLALYEELERDASSYENRAVLRIGSSITIANFWLPKVLQSFQKQTNTRAKVEVDRASVIISKLKQNEIDIAFIEGVLPQGDFTAVPFSAYRLKLVCAPAYSISKSIRNDPQELVKERFLLREQGSAIRNVFDSALELKQLAAEPLWTSVNSQALLQAARSGLGITVLPDMLVAEDLKQGTLMEVETPWLHLENKNYILYHKEKYISQPLQLLIALTKELFCK